MRVGGVRSQQASRTEGEAEGRAGQPPRVIRRSWLSRDAGRVLGAEAVASAVHVRESAAAIQLWPFEFACASRHLFATSCAPLPTFAPLTFAALVLPVCRASIRTVERWGDSLGSLVGTAARRAGSL